MREGQKIEITKRGRVIARLLPASHAMSRSRPDFLARLRAIYRAKTLKVSGTKLLAKERDRY